jgi:hypothetical protein
MRNFIMKMVCYDMKDFNSLIEGIKFEVKLQKNDSKKKSSSSV